MKAIVMHLLELLRAVLFLPVSLIVLWMIERNLAGILNKDVDMTQLLLPLTVANFLITFLLYRNVFNKYAWVPPKRIPVQVARLLQIAIALLFAFALVTILLPR